MFWGICVKEASSSAYSQAPDWLAPDRLAPDRLAPDRLAPDRLFTILWAGAWEQPRPYHACNEVDTSPRIDQWFI